MRTSLLAGAGTAGSSNGSDSSAQFYHPRNLGVDGSGRILVADWHNHTIRRIDHFGSVITLAGSAGHAGYKDGARAEAMFNYPAGVHIAEGDILVADSWNHCIRAVSSKGETRTVAGDPGLLGFGNGSGSSAQFSCPHDITLDREGNILVADTDNNAIRKIDPAGNVTTLAGTGAAGHKDGDATSAEFNKPKGITMDAIGEYCIVADTGNHCIRRVSPSGLAITVAGIAESGFVDGEGRDARFSYPMGISLDADGRYIVADAANNRVRMVTAKGTVTTVVGAGDSGYSEGTGAAALFHGPAGVAVSPNGGFLVADCWNHRIRYVSDTPNQHAYGAAPASSSFAGIAAGGLFEDGTELDPDAERKCTAVQLLRRECERQLSGDGGIAKMAAKYEIQLREAYDKRINSLETQRRQMEDAIALRAQELDAELAERRYQCEVECKQIVEAKRTRVEALLKSLEKLGPDEIAAAADARNLRLRAEIDRLRLEVEEVKSEQSAQLAQTSSATTGQESSFMEDLLNFDADIPARQADENLFDPQNPKVDTTAKLQQLRLQQQVRELEAAKKKAIEVEDYIRADELKEEIRKLKKKEGGPAPRPIVTVTHLRVHDEKVQKFMEAWQEPPRTRLLQDTTDDSVFIMYEAHPTRADADAMISTSDDIKWGEIASWLAEATKTHVFTAVHST